MPDKQIKVNVDINLLQTRETIHYIGQYGVLLLEISKLVQSTGCPFCKTVGGHTDECIFNQHTQDLAALLKAEARLDEMLTEAAAGPVM